MRRIQTGITICDTSKEMACAAAQAAADRLRTAIAQNGAAYLIAATGASQLEMLGRLVAHDIDWPRVTMFHLDEYVGLSITHKASFRKYLTENLTSRVPFKDVYFLDGDAPDPAEVCRRVGEAIRRVTIDVALVGIGENGHLAFNDPPADFKTDAPYLIVDLDEACRRQQVGEGWFGSLDEVPRQALSMSVREIMRARTIICTVPDARKAAAVRKTIEGAIGPERPASILRLHPDCHFFLDRAAASQLQYPD
ncbi:glucosamine-6-phosphate deaminase [bacterium]|nr:glucosamine-6-phosphate deaminase [bacterium]